MSNTSTAFTRSARLRNVPLAKLRVSQERTQREFIPAWADHLFSVFDPDKFETPTVSERDGWFYIVIGQHRLAALKMWLGEGWEEQQVQAWVFSDLTEAQEAELFEGSTDVKRISAFERFKVRVNAGRQIENDIRRVVLTQGLVISRDQTPGAIRAVATLAKVYKRSDADTLGRTLRLIRDAYGDTGLEAVVIDGIGHLCQRYNGVLDDAATVAKLGNTHGGVNGLLSKAELLRKQTGTTKALCVAAAAVEIINSGKGKKLPSWWKSS